MSTVREIAASAYQELEADRAAERRREDERRAAERAERDREALAEALATSPIVAWFPGVEWQLLDREIPMQPGAVVVAPVDEPGLAFMLLPDTAVATVQENARVGRERWHRESRVQSAADVGRVIHEREARATAQRESGLG